MKYRIKHTNSKWYPTYLQVNICSDVAECGQGMAGCELENEHPISPVGEEKTLQYSTDGILQLTYRGPVDVPTGSKSTIENVQNKAVHAGSWNVSHSEIWWWTWPSVHSFCILIKQHYGYKQKYWCYFYVFTCTFCDFPPFFLFFFYFFFAFSSATRDTFRINFVCDPKSYPGSLKLVREDMSTSPKHVVHDVLFEFSTALACMPAPVDCRITGLDTHTHKLSWLLFFQVSLFLEFVRLQKSLLTWTCLH